MNKHKQGDPARIDAQTKMDAPSRDYLVTVFKALQTGHLYALVLRVTVSESIEWVRAHVDEIVAIGVRHNSMDHNTLLPIVALNVELA